MLVLLDRDRLTNDEIWGGQFALASPHSKYWGTRPPVPLVIYAYVATSCKNLVNFCRVTPEITGLMCVPRYLYLVKIDLHICIRHAAIQKRHEALERWLAH